MSRLQFVCVVLSLCLLSVVATVATPERRGPGDGVTVILYGDTRFTDPANTTAANPTARAALVARIADEQPDAIVINGDLPWHGGDAADYDVFRSETAAWRAHALRVIPALGNHEFSKGDPAECLEHWWTAFPELRGKRWHAEDVGSAVRVLALDTLSPLVDGSEQRTWLEHEIATLPESIQFVLVALHHPPVADIQTRLRVDHNPRPNEIALADYLAGAARRSHARFLVASGHIHNYERFLRDDVAYLVSGGGGAVPYEVDRTPDDLYQASEFPNFHYVKLTIANGTMTGVMWRLDDPSATTGTFTVKDRFELPARQNRSAGVPRTSPD
jgi:3',5'-cyclic AMP phosphodiesterase CpdA